VGEDLYTRSSSDEDASGPEAEALDAGSRAAQLINYHKERITRVLPVAIGDSPHAEETAGTLFRVVPVKGGAAAVLSEGERAYVVWAQIEDGRVSSLCTCGGIGCGESAELRSWLGTSSSC